MSVIGTRTIYTEECGFRPSFDTYMLNCSAQYSGRFGFYIRSSQSRIVGGISFYNGLTVPSEGWGYFFEGSSHHRAWRPDGRRYPGAGQPGRRHLSS
jgi:hypothetical protein